MESEQGLSPLSDNKPTESNQTVSYFADWADSLCPYYMALGVTYNEYWHGDYSILPYYVEAHELRNEQRNQEMWMQGMYIHDAVSISIYNSFKKKSDKAEHYPKEPYALTKQESDRRAKRDRQIALETAKTQFEAWSETLDIDKGGETNGSNNR